jgi:AraC-like DNA-binding protein
MQFRPHQCGRVRCEPGWHLGPSWAKALHDFDLWYVWEGRGRMRLSSGEITLRPGVCLWMRPGRIYEAVQDAKAPLGVNYIHFSACSRADNLPLSAFAPPFEVHRTHQVEFVDTLMKRIIDLGPEPHVAAATTALLTGLIAELNREYTAAATMATSGTEQHHRDVVMQTAAQIRESPAQTPTVNELAANAGYSVDHFSRIFLKIAGTRPQDYIINAKIERARQLLAESDLTVGSIAEVVGFQDIFYFSRQFTQKTGATPTEFRRGLRVV